MCLSDTIIEKKMGEPSVQLLQNTGVPLAQVSEQSGGEKGSRDFFIRNLVGGCMLAVIACTWSHCANTRHNCLSLLQH